MWIAVKADTQRSGVPEICTYAWVVSQSRSWLPVHVVALYRRLDIVLKETSKVIRVGYLQVFDAGDGPRGSLASTQDACSFRGDAAPNKAAESHLNNNAIH